MRTCVRFDTRKRLFTIRRDHAPREHLYVGRRSPLEALSTLLQSDPARRLGLMALFAPRTWRCVRGAVALDGR